MEGSNSNCIAGAPEEGPPTTTAVTGLRQVFSVLWRIVAASLLHAESQVRVQGSALVESRFAYREALVLKPNGMPPRRLLAKKLLGRSLRASELGFR